MGLVLNALMNFGNTFGGADCMFTWHETLWSCWIWVEWSESSREFYTNLVSLWWRLDSDSKVELIVRFFLMHFLIMMVH